MRKLFGLLAMAAALNANAQDQSTLSIRNWDHQQEASLIKVFTQFLSIPNLADDQANIERNAAFIQTMMKEYGLENIQLLHPRTTGAPPAIFGEVRTPGATQTLVFYAHYDGQPVNPAQWTEGLQPFTPHLYTGSILSNAKEISFPNSNTYQPEWRIYARSASDDKAGVFAILNAYHALVKTGMHPTYNLKFFFEGEEEAGSIHLNEILEQYRALLQSDLWVICDGPVHQSGNKQIFFGARGDTHVDLTVYGPTRPLHSGHYGNWAPNPALMLAKLLASMKDETGRVTIKDFYNDVIPLTAVEKKAVAQVPQVDEQLKKELGLNRSEIESLSLNEAINLPSLNINGMQSGNVGKMASNQIPTYATAALDLRLVLGNDWQRQTQKLIDHIKAQGYTVVDHDPTPEELRNNARLAKVVVPAGSYNAQRTPMDLPIAQKVIRAVQQTTKGPLVVQPTTGGSLPLYLFETILQAKTVTVPIANHDNNQHAENENIRLQNLWDGIETMAAIMRMEK